MDRERAIEILNNLTFNLDFEDGTSEKDINDIVDAINMAIKALAIPSADMFSDLKAEISMYENSEQSIDEMIQGIKSIISIYER